jgi:hypothetical protein
LLDTEKLQMLKTLLDIADTRQDPVLDAYLRIGKDTVMRYAYPCGVPAGDEPVFPDRYDILQVRIAEALYLRAGAEGETSHSENGVSRSYLTDGVPKHLLSQIVPFAGIPS